MVNDRTLAFLILVVSAFVVLGSIYFQYSKYDPSKSGLLVYTWAIGELPLGFTHFGYQPDSMIYLDITQRIYKYGLIGYFKDPAISGTWELFRYYVVVIFGRPLSHVSNLIVYGIWPDPSALLVLPALSGIIGPVIFYYLLKEFKFRKLFCLIGALLLLTNKYFLFESGEALFDSQGFVLGIFMIYFWLRCKRLNDFSWLGTILTIGLLYRQTNAIVFLSCLAYDFLSGELKDKKWYFLPLAITCLLVPIYLFHLVGGWTFFTPGLIEVEYKGSILTKPAYFISTWFIAFGLLGAASVLGLIDWFLTRKEEKLDAFMAIYLIMIWAFNFMWAINMGRFWMVAIPPVVFFTLRIYQKLNPWLLIPILLYNSLVDINYSIIANLIRGGLI